MDWTKFDSYKAVDFSGSVNARNVEQLMTCLLNKNDCGIDILAVVSPSTLFKLTNIDYNPDNIITSNTVSDDVMYLFVVSPLLFFSPEKCCVAGYNL